MSGMRRSMLIASRMCVINVIAANTSLIDAEVIEGDSYSTQIVCNEGYSIYEITIKMGGVDITSTAYDATYNMISIPSVTDDVDIECYAMHSMPSDYVRVDGIKNPSDAYIDTGYTLSYKNIVTIDSTLLGGGDGYIIGSKVSTSAGTQGTLLRIYTGYSNLWYDPSTVGITEMTGINTVGRNSVVFDHYNGKVYGNGVLKKTYSKKNNTDAAVACLFKCSPSNTQQSANMIINSCYIYDATTKVYERYYIPCLNANGVAGFWNAAQGVFQGSSNSTAFQPVYVQDNLIAHYDGIDNAGVGVHDASATTWKDLKGNYDATTDSAITWDSNGFTNNSDRRLFKAFPNIIKTISPVDFTIECVFKPASISSGGARPTLVSNYNGATNINRLHVNIRTNVFVAFNSSASVQTPDGLLDNGNSYTVTIRRAGNTCAIFVNGVKAAEKNIGYLRFTLNDQFYEIGSYFSTSYAFKGTYYAHRVYTKALTDEEIKGNYNIDKLRFNF